MITALKFKNCFTFGEEINFDLNADMRTQKFLSNVYEYDEHTHILKSAVIYGPNNTGKTAFMRCVKSLKETLLNEKPVIQSNIFEKSKICEIGIEFLSNNIRYYYEYRYNSENKEYVYEIFKEIKIDKYDNQTDKMIILKDTINNKYSCPEDRELENFLRITAKDNILIYLIETLEFKVLTNMKKALLDLANKIEVIDMNSISNKKTIEFLKSKNKFTERVVEFIKNADLYLEDYYYNNNFPKNVNEEEFENVNAKAPKNQSLGFVDQIRLTSVYRGKSVPSIMYDSIGTKKIVALASYIIEAIDNGKALFIDELDSSLHFKITRAIVSMFNNDINKTAQLIATLHDISLLDCKNMFRKEQIWFTDKDSKKASLYSLKDFSYNQSGVRETSDVKEQYNKGKFGAIPDPDLISILLEEN